MCAFMLKNTVSFHYIILNNNDAILYISLLDYPTTLYATSDFLLKVICECFSHSVSDVRTHTHIAHVSVRAHIWSMNAYVARMLKHTHTRSRLISFFFFFVESPISMFSTEIQTEQQQNNKTQMSRTHTYTPPKIASLFLLFTFF